MVVVVLALAAALLFAVSDFLEQRAARRAAHGEPGHAEPSDSRLEDIVQRLFHDRRWLAGWATGTVAFFVQAAALHEGSVGVVQALQVTTLLFSFQLSTIGRSKRPRRWDWLAGALTCLGIALLLLLRHRSAASPYAHRYRILFLLLLLAVAIAALAALAATRKGAARAMLLATAAGAAFACSATLVKLTGHDLTAHGIPHTATDWPGWALGPVTGIGVLLQQTAFAAGRLPTATTAMVVANPITATAIAFIGFGEPVPSGAPRIAGFAVAAALVAIGIAILSHSPLLQPDDDEQHQAPQTLIDAGSQSSMPA